MSFGRYRCDTHAPAKWRRRRQQHGNCRWTCSTNCSLRRTFGNRVLHKTTVQRRTRPRLGSGSSGEAKEGSWQEAIIVTTSAGRRHYINESSRARRRQRRRLAAEADINHAYSWLKLAGQHRRRRRHSACPLMTLVLISLFKWLPDESTGGINFAISPFVSSAR